MKKRLLVVVDMQKDFVTGCLGTEAAQAIVKDVAQYVREFDGDVMATKDTHLDNYLETQEGRKLPVPHCIKGTVGWEIVDDIAEALEEAKAVVLEKGIFGSVDLGEVVKNAGYDEVVLVGVCTGICVISNAIAVRMFSPETTVQVVKDLCACVTPETHQTAIAAMQNLQIDII